MVGARCWPCNYQTGPLFPPSLVSTLRPQSHLPWHWLAFLSSPALCFTQWGEHIPPTSFCQVILSYRPNDKGVPHSHMASIYLYPLLLTCIPSVSRCIPSSPKCVTCCPELLSSPIHLFRSLLHVSRTDRPTMDHPWTLGDRSEQDRQRHECCKLMF